MNLPANHNMASLTPVEQATYSIEASLEGPTARFAELQAACERAPVKIETQTDAEAYTTVIAQLQAVRARIEAAHDEVKEPWLEAGRVVDGASRRLDDQVVRLLTTMNDRLTAYQVARLAAIEAERAKTRAVEAEDPEPTWVPHREMDSSRRAARVRSVEGASAHLQSTKYVEIVDVRKIPLRYLKRPKVLAAIATELRPDAIKGDVIPGIKLHEQAQSRVKK